MPYLFVSTATLVTAVLFVASFIAFLVFYRRSRLAENAAAEALAALNYANDNCTVYQARADKSLARSDELELELRTAKRDRDTATHKHDDLFTLVTGIIAERDEWKSIHIKNSASAANAQNMMIEVISRQAAKLKAAGLKDEIPIIIRHVMAERDAHGDDDGSGKVTISQENG